MEQKSSEEKLVFSKIDNKYKMKITLWIQLILACFIFVTELAGNYVLYVTRSQGYGPDTIIAKLMRYLVLTTSIDFGLIIICQIIVRKSKNILVQKYALIITTALICTNIVYSHYQFTVVFGMFVIPIILSCIYEDSNLTLTAAIVGTLGLTIGVISRAMDPLYNHDVIPEATIGYMLILLCFLLIRILLKSIKERRELLDDALVGAEKAKYLDKVEEMSIQVLEAFAHVLDAKDKYTNGHSYRVSEYSVKLAKALGFETEEIEIIRKEALLHDIGKISIPDSVLNARGKLSELEFKIMKSHTTAGSDIMRNMVIIPGTAAVAGEHHERYDGHGYPMGLSGKNIHPHARIVCIADAYDAMSSDRIYREALKRDKIRTELINGRGTQFDPEYLDVFLDLFDRNELQINDDNEKGEYSSGILVKKVSISIETALDVEVSAEELKEAEEKVGVSIKKNIRSTDKYVLAGERQHIIILSYTDDENVEMIVQRIFLDFYKMYDKKNIVLMYEITEG